MSPVRKLRYEHSDKAKGRKKRYESSDKGKAASEKYAASSKGKLRYLRHYYKDRPGEFEALVKNRAQWTKDVHSFAEKHGMTLYQAVGILHSYWLREGQFKEAASFLKWKRDRRRDRFLSRWYWQLWYIERSAGRIRSATSATNQDDDTLPAEVLEAERRAGSAGTECAE